MRRQVGDDVVTLGSSIAAAMTITERYAKLSSPHRVFVSGVLQPGLLYRRYKELGLQLRHKPPKRRVKGKLR